MPKDLHQTLDPATIHVANSIAGQQQEKTVATDVIQSAQRGMTIDQQNQARREDVAKTIASAIGPMLSAVPGWGGMGGNTPATKASGSSTSAANIPVPEDNAGGRSPEAAVGSGAGPSMVNTPAAPTQQDDLQRLMTDQNEAYNKLINEQVGGLQTAYGAAPQIPTVPDLKAPNLAQSAFGLAGALLFPRFAMDAAGAPFMAQIKENDERYQRGLQTYALQNQAWQEDIANRRGLIGILAGQQSHNLQMQQHVMQLQYQNDWKQSRAVDYAFNSYRQSPSKATFDHLNSLLVATGQEKMGDEQLAGDMKIHNLPIAQQRFEKMVKDASSYGVVDDSKQEQLTTARLEIGRQMGLIDPNDTIEQQRKDATAIGIIPSGKSFKEMAIQQKRDAIDIKAAQFGQTLQWKKDSFEWNMSMRQADLDLATWKAQQFVSHQHEEIALGKDRNAIALYGHQLFAAVKTAQDKVLSTANAKLVSLNQERARQTGVVAGFAAIKSPSKTQTEALAREKAKLDGIENEIKFVGSSVSSTTEYFDPANPNGTITAPNSDYLGGQQQQQMPGAPTIGQGYRMPNLTKAMIQDARTKLSEKYRQLNQPVPQDKIQQFEQLTGHRFNQ